VRARLHLPAGAARRHGAVGAAQFDRRAQPPVGGGEYAAEERGGAVGGGGRVTRGACAADC